MGSVISAGINQVTSLAGNAVDYIMNRETNNANERINNHTNDSNLQIARETNEANKAINQANIDYQNAYNQQVFEREDTAFQRMAKDASAVGINPLAISQGSPSGGTASAPQASIPMQGATMQGYRENPFVSKMADVSALAGISNEINTIMTGIAQRDILHEQAVKAKNENDFFAENGYYPAPPTDFERFLTGVSNVIEGKGAISHHVDVLKDAFTDNVAKPLSDLKSVSLPSISLPANMEFRSPIQLYKIGKKLKEDDSHVKDLPSGMNKDSMRSLNDYTGTGELKQSSDSVLKSVWSDFMDRVKTSLTPKWQWSMRDK